jgi:hypothetical protein
LFEGILEHEIRKDDWTVLICGNGCQESFSELSATHTSDLSERWQVEPSTSGKGKCPSASDPITEKVDLTEFQFQARSRNLLEKAP